MRILVVAILCLAAHAHALTVRALSLDELIAHADRIVHARCVGVTPAAPHGAFPVVEVTLAVDETLKGEADERLVIRQVGGRFERLLPTCRPGDEVVLFLHAPSGAGLTSPVGLGQGYLRVRRDPGRAALVVGDPRLVGALSGGAAVGTARALGTAAPRERMAPLDAALEELRRRLGGTR